MNKYKIIFFALYLIFGLFLSPDKVFSQSEKDYFINPFSFDIKNARKYLPPKIVRPLNSTKYLFEFLNEGKSSKDYDYLTAKRIEVLYELGNIAKIIGNYSNLDELLQWKDKIWPEKYEFWRYSEEDSWEASLAEYYSLYSSYLDEIIQQKFETERFKNLIDIKSIILQQKDKIDYRIGSLQKTPDEKKYLFVLSNEIFSSLLQKIEDNIYLREDNSYTFSLLPIIKNNDFGKYFVWVDLNKPLTGNITISVKYNNDVLQKVNDKTSKNIFLGQILIENGSEWIQLKLPKNIILEESKDYLKLYLKKEDRSNEIITPVNDNKFIISIIKILVTTLLITIISLFKKKISLIIKKFINLRFDFIKLLQKLTPWIIYLFAISTIIIRGNVDLIIIRSFLFWTFIAVIWNIHSSITFFGAFILFLLCPYLIARRNKVDLVETYAIISYFLFISGMIQLALQDFLHQKKNLNKLEAIKQIIVFITSIVVTFIFYKILFNFKTELNYYSYYFGNEYKNEFVNRFYFKIPLIIILTFIIYLFLNKFSKRLKINLKNTGNLAQMIISNILLLITLTIFLLINKQLLLIERSQFINNPRILNVVPDRAYAGDEVTITGKSFLDQSKKGKVFLEGREQKVISWDDKTIIFKVDENLSSTGELIISNKYNNRWTNSNGIDFSFEGTKATDSVSNSF